MHNWNLAILEHLQLLTHEQAQKLSDEVKIRIHKEVYSEAYREVENIIGNNSPLKVVSDLTDKVKVLEAKIAELTKPTEAPKPPVIAPKIKSVAQLKT